MNYEKAYPSQEIDFRETIIQGKTIYENQNLGMDLRDYFAAKALEGVYANNEMLRSMCMDRKNCTRDKEKDTHEDYVAQQCYRMADAMLKERNEIK